MLCYFFFFFQAEDGIRDYKVTGVQTCALPIYDAPPARTRGGRARLRGLGMKRAARIEPAGARTLRAGATWPARGDLRTLARQGNLIPVCREILADLETPVSAFLKIHRGPYGFLLESVEGGEKWGRYSFLGTEPARVFRSRGRSVEMETPGRPPVREVVEDPFEAAYDAAVARIDALVARLAAPPVEPAPVDAAPGEVGSNFTQAAYEKVVTRAKEYIRAGDVIQVVLAQRFELPLAAPPFNVYRCLRTVNPSPYMFYLALGDHALAGASPEVMVRVEDGEVTVRPIAGTRPRGTVEREDVALAAELDPVKRGVYGGAVGYFAFSGAMDTAITIRFVLFRNGRVYIQAGAGIVADSDPEAEHRECVNKSRAMIQAVRLAEAL